MDLSEIARELVVANRENRVDGFLDAHYAEDVVSAEPRPGANGLQVTETLEQLRQKHAWWSENMEVHSMTVDGPWLQHPDRFAVRFETDATNRSDASRSPRQRGGRLHGARGQDRPRGVLRRGDRARADLGSLRQRAGAQVRRLGPRAAECRFRC